MWEDYAEGYARHSTRILGKKGETLGCSGSGSRSDVCGPSSKNPSRSAGPTGTRALPQVHKSRPWVINSYASGRASLVRRGSIG